MGAASGAGIAIGAYFAFYGAASNLLARHTEMAPGGVAFVAGGIAAAGGSVVKVPLAVCIRSVQVQPSPSLFHNQAISSQSRRWYSDRMVKVCLARSAPALSTYSHLMHFWKTTELHYNPLASCIRSRHHGCSEQDGRPRGPRLPCWLSKESSFMSQTSALKTLN